MYTLAIICYTVSVIAFLIALLLMIAGAKSAESSGSFSDGILSLPYNIRIFCRYAYLILLPLGGLLHYLS